MIFKLMKTISHSSRDHAAVAQTKPVAKMG